MTECSGRPCSTAGGAYLSNSREHPKLPLDAVRALPVNPKKYLLKRASRSASSKGLPTNAVNSKLPSDAV